FVVAPSQFTDVHFSVITRYLGMPVYSVQKNTSVVIAEVHTVLYGQFDGIVHLHADTVSLAPTPSPTVVPVAKKCSCGNHAGAVLKLHVDFIQTFLHPFFIVAIGLDMDFYLHSVFVPGSDVEIAVAVVHFEKGIGIYVVLFFNG